MTTFHNGFTKSSTSGNDVFSGSFLFDTVSYAAATTGVVVDLNITGPQNTRHGVDTLTSVEGLIGGSFDDRLIGNSQNNVLDGGAGAGIDTLDGGLGIDTVSYASANAAVTVSLGITGLQNTVGAGFDQLSNFENLRGSRFGDRLTGNAGENLIDGGAGNDILDGGLGIDTASYASASSAVFVSLSDTGLQNTGGAGFDQLSNFENLRGSSFDDYLRGNSSGNVLDGGAGVDTVSYSNSSSGVRVRLDTNAAQDTGGAGLDTLLSIENLTGSNSADQLTGNSGVNTLTGLSGNDTLIGGRGADVLSGGSGADRFVYTSVLDSTVSAADRITDFAPSLGDKIDLSQIDANTALSGNQAFSFVGSIVTNPARLNQGELGMQVSGSDLLLYGNTGNSTGTPDFMLRLSGLGASGVIAGDFIL